MDQNKERVSEFCQNLGQLFYAIALADKTIKEEEFKALKLHLSDLNFTSFFKGSQVDIEYQVTSTFNALYLEAYDAQRCFIAFVKYKIKNEDLFSKPVKKTILQIAGKIAASFSGQNKSELIMLAKLNLEFNKNEK